MSSDIKGYSRAPREGVARGFTLLEMLLTVFLIGLAASLVALNVEQNTDDIARLEAKRFAALVSHLQDESTIIGLPMGIEVREIENRYKFWELTDSWAEIEKQKVLRERLVPETVSIELDLLQEKRSQKATLENPQQIDSGESDLENVEQKNNPAPKGLLIVDPTGITAPFIARFIGEKLIYSVSLDNELNPVLASAQK